MTTWPEEPFTRAELGRLDLSDADVRRGHRANEIRTVVRGVYVATTLEDSLDLRAAAIAKATKPHQVVTDRTAAWLHGVDTHVYAEHDGMPPIETCALRWKAPTRVDGVRGRTRDLQPHDVMRIAGIRVTTPLRTALDLGCLLRRREAFAALCAIAREHDLTRGDYQQALGRYRRRRGVVQLRELVALVDPRFESAREAWCYLAIADASLPLPEPQLWIEVDGVPTYRLDLAFRRRRICVEYDGGEAHSSPEQRAYDEVRRRWLRAHGWIVIVVREGDFTGDALDRWLGKLRGALATTYDNRRW